MNSGKKIRVTHFMFDQQHLILMETKKGVEKMKKKRFLTPFIVGMTLTIVFFLAWLTHVPCQAD